MKRIGILTAGGDTPALNATIAGAVQRANQARVEVFGIIKGFSGLLNPQVPHVHLNPLFHSIPVLDPTRGGTILGASRDYVNADDTQMLARVADRLAKAPRGARGERRALIPRTSSDRTYCGAHSVTANMQASAHRKRCTQSCFARRTRLGRLSALSPLTSRT